MQTQPPRRAPARLALLCALLLSLALATGCASNGKDEPPPLGDGAAAATPSADSPQAVSNVSEEEAREVAEKVLLRLKDFPVGWSQLPPEEDDEDPELDLPEECKTFFEQEIPLGAIVDIDSPEFEGPDDEEVDSGATVYADAEAARQAFLDARQFMDRCKDPFREAFTKYLQQLYQEKAQESGQNIEWPSPWTCCRFPHTAMRAFRYG